MRFPLIFIPIVMFLQVDSNDPQNALVPYINTSLQQLDGSTVSVRYRAVHWDPIRTTAVLEDPQSRQYYNQYVLPEAIQLESNVELGIGRGRLDPGTYQLGINVASLDEATLVVSDQDNTLFRFPVQIRQEENTVPHFSVVLMPGVTDRDFNINALYGDLSLKIKMRFTGVPSQTIQQPSSPTVPPVQQNLPSQSSSQSSQSPQSTQPSRLEERLRNQNVPSQSTSNISPPSPVQQQGNTQVPSAALIHTSTNERSTSPFFQAGSPFTSPRVQGDAGSPRRARPPSLRLEGIPGRPIQSTPQNATQTFQRPSTNPQAGSGAFRSLFPANNGQ